MMRKLLAILAAAALMAPVARAEFFQVTGDGSFDTYRSGAGEGYSNGGGTGVVRLEKYNQAMGWMSFYGAKADGTNESLASYLARTPTATATLYFRSATVNMGAAGAYMVSIRSGNTGAMVEDQGNGNGFGTSNPDPGFAGASELEAFRGCAPYPTTTYPNFGDGIYTGELVANGGGTPWITPSTRAASTGGSPCKTGPNQPIQYDKGLVTTGTANNKFVGYMNDTSTGGGRSYFALEDLLGMYNNNARGGAIADVQNAGQIINGGFAAPTLVNNALYAASDPRNKGGVATANWIAVPIDAAFLADMANNPENKGFALINNLLSGQAQDWNNSDYYTKEQQGGIYAPYLYVTPEPATMVLLALGGLVALRRRSA